jgi:hypothetical protein
MNSTYTALPLAARTASINSDDIQNFNAKGVHVIIDVTAVTATPSITVTLQGKDFASGKYYTILASAAITGTGTTVLKVFPGSAVSANSTANDIAPYIVRVSVANGDTDSITYSVGLNFVD